MARETKLAALQREPFVSTLLCIRRRAEHDHMWDSAAHSLRVGMASDMREVSVVVVLEIHHPEGAIPQA